MQGFQKKNGLPQPLHVFAMTRREKRIAVRLAEVAPAGSVGASALQRCPPDTHTAITRISKNSRNTVLCCINKIKADFNIDTENPKKHFSYLISLAIILAENKKDKFFI